MQFFHLHIPKTAGTSLRSAFESEGRKVALIGPEYIYAPERDAEAELISGHAGRRVAQTIPGVQGRVLTILRDPLDRAASYYFHLVRLFQTGEEISDRTLMASKYDLHEFFGLKDHPHLLSDLYNAMTWQILWDRNIEQRREYRSREPRLDDSELLRRAKAHLEGFLVVGLQEQMEPFARKLKAATGFAAPLGADLVNPDRVPLADIPAATQRRMRDWLELDLELYAWARGEFGRD